MKMIILPGLAVLLTMVLLMTLGTATAPAQDRPIGEFTANTDVGAPAIAGAAAYDAATQTYVVTGAGVNIWGKRDEFQFVWKKLKGNFILQTRAEFEGKGAEPHRKMGWMVRAGLDADAPYADAAVHGDGLTSLQFRRVAGAETEERRLGITGPDVLQLERKGARLILSAARFGEPFATNETVDLPLGDEVYVGLFVCAHNSNVVEKAVFQNVRLIRPAKEGFVPYNDYIGSYLEILDVNTGRREVVRSSAEPFEAPNWTPDGSALIYNTSGSSENLKGRLYRFDLATLKPSIINTEFAIRNNNDHVISFDGRMMGLSHQGPEHNSQSAVYTVPIAGGTPKLITPNFPSYLHGWSPDGRFLVYTGGRNGKFDVYRIRAAGGDEVRLTAARGLNDGPEYSPDGKFIYFNSDRDGLMQLWRMKPDGRNQEPMTRDEFNNWFPHVSPDGKWIAFVSYSREVAPAEHPYYQPIYLRLMPAEGGAARVIAYVYGGQGTMNVPSWSPDSRRLAFVSNSDLP